MAANRILHEFYGFLNFVNSGFKYNLQVFPDTLTASALLFTLLFQSPPLGALSGSILLLQCVHPIFARFLSSVIGGTVQAEGGTCTGHFPGISYERLIGMSSRKSFGALDSANWPSYYSSFIGFLIGYTGSLPLLYQKELAASPKRHAATILGLVVLSIITLLCVAYRVLSGCESAVSSFVGIVSGIFFGLLCIGFLAWVSDRRITNILSLPLIRERAADGKPIYVCERPIYGKKE